MIGILGGTFDPVHFGHLRSALEIQQSLGLDEVRLVPAHAPPHRPQPLASPQQRVEMLQAAIADTPTLSIDTREFERSGPSYTLDTLVSLRDEFPGTGLCLLVGMDAFRGFSSWHRWREITEYAHVIVMTRPGVTAPEQKDLTDFIALHRVMDSDKLAEQNAGLLLYHAVSQLDISATHIRKLLASGQRADYLLPGRVLGVIKSNMNYVE